MTTNTWSWQSNHVRVRVRDDDVDDDDDDDDNDAGVGVVARVRVNVAGTSSKGCSGASGRQLPQFAGTFALSWPSRTWDLGLIHERFECQFNNDLDRRVCMSECLFCVLEFVIMCE